MSPYGVNRKFADCSRCGHPLAAHGGGGCHCGCTASRAGSAQSSDIQTPIGPSIHLVTRPNSARSPLPLPPTPGLGSPRRRSDKKKVKGGRGAISQSRRTAAKTREKAAQKNASPAKRNQPTGNQENSRSTARLVREPVAHRTPQERLVKTARLRFSSLDALHFINKVSARHSVSVRLDSGFDIWSPLERLVIDHLTEADAATYDAAIERRHREGLPLIQD